MADENIRICTQLWLPQELQARAALVAITENPANAYAYQHAMAVNGQNSIADIPEHIFLALPTAKMWNPGRELTVVLNGGTDFVRSKVRQYALVWSYYANIKLKFVDSASAIIRVGFVQGGSNSYVGTDNLLVAQGTNTMNYGWFDDDTPEDEFSRVVTHEFGHALGCIHEHQSPAANIPWNRPAVYAYYAQPEHGGWTPAQVDLNIFDLASRNSTQFSQFDVSSIMLYAIPASLTTNGFSVGWNRVLSNTDKAFIDQMYPISDAFTVFHQGSGNSGDLWFNGFGKLSWHGDVQISNTGASASPSAVDFNGKTYVFHQGGGDNGQLWYNVFDGANWAGDQLVDNTGMSASPSAVVFGGKIYVFHQGGGNNGELWYNVFDGTNWTGDTLVPNTGMSASPGAIVLGGKLYAFHQGSGNNGQLWYNSSSDGANWAGDQLVADVGISDSPATAEYNNLALVFHQGGGDNGELWYSLFDGSFWAKDQQVPGTGMSASPSAVKSP